MPVRTILRLYGRDLVIVFEDTKLVDVLKVFKSGRGHLAIVAHVHNEGPGDPYYDHIGYSLSCCCCCCFL